MYKKAMRLEYEVTKNDKAQFAKSIIRLRNNPDLNLIIIVALSLVIVWAIHALHHIHGGAMIYLSTSGPAIRVSLIRDVAVFIASLATLSTVITLNIKSTYHQLLNCRAKQLTVSCHEHGVDVQQDNKYSYHPWNGTRALIKTNCAIYLYKSEYPIPASNDGNCIIIPKQVFTTQLAFSRFAQFIEKHAASSQHIA